MEEIWKDVFGYEGIYQVSSFGRVKRLERIIKTVNGVSVLNKEIIRKQSLMVNGYFQIKIHNRGIEKRYLSHRLVAFHFIPNPDNKPCVNHKNGIRNDNRVENLEWVTTKENIHHAIEFGNQDNVGEKHPMAKLNESEVFDIKYNLGHLSNKDVAKKFNVSRDIIWRIRNFKNWTHV